jgi:hypothetical protein
MASSIPGTFTSMFSSSRAGRSAKVKGVVGSLCTAFVLLCASTSRAGDTCTASVEKSPCAAASGGGDDYCCAPGWVFDNNWANSGGIAVTFGSNSMQFTQKYNLNNSCCEALYAGIGNIGSTVVTDTYLKAGSYLPLQLKDIAVLKGAWTIKVPPVKSTDIYRVYYEIFLSSTTQGLRDKGNLTIDFYHPTYDYGGKISHTTLMGYSNMEVVDYGANTNGQGPFIAFALPSNAYTPDSNGVINIKSADVASVLNWALMNYPNYYTNTVYLTELNLAEECMTVNGTFTTTLASFEVQKTGSPVAYTPTWTDTYWTSGTLTSSAPESTDGGTSSGAASGSGSSGGAASGSGSSGGTAGASSSAGAASGGSSGASTGSSGGAPTGESPGVGTTGSSGGVASGGTPAAAGAPASMGSTTGMGTGQGGCSAGGRASGKGSAALLALALGLTLRRGRRGRAGAAPGEARQRS